MPLNLCDYETKAQAAIKGFWQTRADAKQKQIVPGKADQGERAGVTGGKNMDGFSSLVIDLVRANGLPDATIHRQRAVLTLPGYFRPSKLWDLLVMDKGRLVAAVEFKSHVSPSFGNNFIQQSRRGSHRNRLRLVDRLPRRCVRQASASLCGLGDGR